MYKGKILLISSYTREVKHARMLYEYEVLQQSGYEVEILFAQRKIGLIYEILDLMTFKFFSWRQIINGVKVSKDFDFILIYGLCMLPISLLIRDSKTRLVYQTLNDDVSYTLFELSIRSSLIKPITPFLDWLMRKVELKLAKRTRCILVNSKSLKEYLKGAKLNYYTSPFEKVQLAINANKPYAILYLGQLREEKGSHAIERVIKKYELPFIFFGVAKDAHTKSLELLPKSQFMGNMEFDSLCENILAISDQYNLIGVSLIEPVHHSYATQEANKDIDYLALGIPFIGNTRLPTLEKVNAGCGVFEEDFLTLLNFEQYERYSHNSLEYYQKYYSNVVFTQRFLSCF